MTVRGTATVSDATGGSFAMPRSSADTVSGDKEVMALLAESDPGTITPATQAGTWSQVEAQSLAEGPGTAKFYVYERTLTGTPSSTSTWTCSNDVRIVAVVVGFDGTRVGTPGDLTEADVPGGAPTFGDEAPISADTSATGSEYELMFVGITNDEDPSNVAGLSIGDVDPNTEIDASSSVRVTHLIGMRVFVYDDEAATEHDYELFFSQSG